MILNQKKLQFLGVCGIFRETFRLIFTATTIFSQITLAFILPLSLLIFALSQTSNLWSIHSLPFNFTLFFFSAVFFFLSTSTAVFSAASTFTDREITFYHLILIAPKVCKQLLITFLCLIVDFLAFNFFALLAITLIDIAIFLLLNYGSVEFLTQLLILFLSVEAFYFALIWQISSVVSVLEADSYGFEAIARSKEVVKGKMAMASILLILIGFPFGGIVFVLRYVVVVESELVRVGILGIIWMYSFMMFLLSGTVLYFVCKLFHGESFDESALSDHLQGYLPIHSESFKVEDDDEDEKSLVV
ncbi:uncharacterized protein LOC120076259 [Benincasa hispida]|uniref:uncharacterized protein LOC120076259 n=1 Tax=Benincasa hispida TaxID=102211 RepID=UPI001901DB87|nr:uncharacterized protein LOC120076259 [Benincasa hispida]